MAQHNELGKWGEQIATEYFITNGYAIGARNVKSAGVEIDIVALKDNEIVFIEVKTRSTDFIDPADAVNHRKRTRLVRAADAYVRQYEIPLEVRFDIFIVVGTPEHYTIEHIPDAFLPTLNNR